MSPSTAPQLEFDPVAHRYQLGERQLVSVTKLLERVLNLKSPFWTRRDSLRGTFVHKLVELAAHGEWDGTAQFPADWEEAEQQKVIRRGHAFEEFRDRTGLVTEASELRVFSELWGFAGTLDLVGKFTRGRYAGLTAIIDVKSGEPTILAPLQVALYEVALGCMGRLSGRGRVVRCVLQLREDGQSRPDYYDTDYEIHAALSCVKVYRYLEHYGKL